jgi:hypothetical protein
MQASPQLEELHKKMGLEQQLANNSSCSGLSSAAEAALNKQVEVELTFSHFYESLSAYFGRDNVALPGLTAFFMQQVC